VPLVSEQPSSRKVVTVLGPIAPEELGVTDAHDHLFLRSPALPGQEFDDAERAIEEVAGARSGGLHSIVEVTPIGLGRRPAGMRAVAESTGVHVVAATGYHRDAHYPHGHWVREAPVELLAKRIVTDLKEGMHPDDWLTDAPLDSARAGVIKAGASYQHISALEERRLVAAAIGNRETGAAILVHTEIGTSAHGIIDVLTREGVRPERIILAHLDRNPDLDLHVEIAAYGVMLEYDTPGRIKYRPDSQLLDLMAGMVEAGHGDRLLLGLDLGQRDYFRAYGGGPGLAYLMGTFVPRLRRRISDAAVHTVLVTNAARAFAFSRP
jgi:phosphotriesterase-related protein